MLFVSLDYLIFLPLAVLLYWAAPRRARLAVMGAASVLFYGSWRLAYLPLLFVIITVAWLGGLWLASLARAEARRGWQRVVCVLALLAPLFVFKYWNWLSGDLVQALASAGLQLELPSMQLPLPIGISFFTFQALAYVVDCGRDGRSERNAGILATFIGFFPQLVAGPIVRRDQLIPTLRDLPLLARGDVGAGLFRILRGLVKKLLIADEVRVAMVDPLFTDPERFTGPELMIGLYAYTLQIYCDFSAYTDIAIGSARLFGITLPENFRRPYAVTNVTAFWRRWHITLSLWVRHYIYFPMGGARAGAMRTYLHLFVTFVVLGIWHGASWNFVIYGAIHGGAMCLHRAFRKRHGRDPEAPMPSAWAWTWRFLVTFHFIVLARVLFRAPDLPTAWGYLQGMLDWSLALPRFAPLGWAVLILGYAIHFTPMAWQQRAQAWFQQGGAPRWALAAAVVATGCALLGTGEQLAFIYYQF